MEGWRDLRLLTSSFSGSHTLSVITQGSPNCPGMALTKQLEIRKKLPEIPQASRIKTSLQLRSALIGYVPNQYQPSQQAWPLALEREATQGLYAILWVERESERCEKEGKKLTALTGGERVATQHHFPVTTLICHRAVTEIQTHSRPVHLILHSATTGTLGGSHITLSDFPASVRSQRVFTPTPLVLAKLLQRASCFHHFSAQVFRRPTALWWDDRRRI